MAQLICKRNSIGYRLRSQTDFSLPRVTSVNCGLKRYDILFQKYEIFFLVILKTLEHFENSQRKLSHGFLETVLVESVKITYIE